MFLLLLDKWAGARLLAVLLDVIVEALRRAGQEESFKFPDLFGPIPGRGSARKELLEPSSRVWQEGHTVQFTNQPALFLSLEGLQLCPLQQWPGGTSRNPSDLTLGQMKLLSSGSLG